jgi:hypothetical protein
VTTGTAKTTGTGTAKTTGTGTTAGTGTTKTTGTGVTTGTGKTTGTGVTTGTGKTTKTDGTGVTSVVKGTGTAGTTGTTKTGTTKAGTSSLGKTIGAGVTKNVADGVTKTLTSAVKPKSPVTKTTPKTGGAGTKATGSATKTATDKDDETGLTDEEVDAELDRARDAGETFGPPDGSVDNGDGTYSVTEDGMVTTYDANGNLLGMEAAEDTTAGEGAGGGEDGGDTATDDEGTTTQVLDDGTVVTLDQNGDIVSYTDTDGITYDGDGNEIDGDQIVGGGDVGGEGNTTETLEDGTEITYDSNGDIVSYTDTDGVTYDGDGEVIDGSDTLVTGDEEVADEEAYEGLYSDDEGNLYDPDGNLVQYADGTAVGEEEFAEDEVAYTDEYGNTYDYNGELIAEADHSDYVQYDDYGNSYDWDGNLIEYAEGYGAEDEYASEDEYAAEDGYSSEDDYSYEDEYSYDDYDDYYDFKKGGVARMQEGGEAEDEDVEPVGEEENEDGTITQYFDDGSSITYDADGEVVDVTEATEDEAAPAFATRGLSARDDGYSDTGEEVQDFQNVGYNFGEFDDPSMTGDNSLYSQSGPTRNTYLTGASASDGATPPEGWPVGFIDNGDGTATYVDDDGSSLTIDADSNIVFVTDANGEVVAQDNEPVTTGGLTQAGQGNRQYFDDGSSIETFDDGSTITYDSDGNVFSNSNAYETTYDDDGNAMVTDSYGNIVAVYDPQGNVIPLGGGRVTGPTQVTGAGGAGAVGVNTQNPVQERIQNQQVGRDTQSAIDKLLAGLNTYGGAGAAGAVLGALLSDSDLFSGGGGGGSSFDMTGVGAINPRTTDFGIGPANYVGYDQYGTPEQMPELYGRELYQNLNAPGFNEVNPGDYARYDAEESGLDQFIEGDAQDQEMADEGQVQGMAEGGMPQGGLGQTAPQTYYTFGTPVDPLQNLRNPAPFQQQPQQPQMQPQLPPQAAQNAQQVPPQQALPQMGMAPTQPSIPQGVPPAGIGMKSGGLPAWSDVPITNGRLNFRKGAPVHGPGDGQSDDIPAMLADGEYVIDAETVAQIGNGSTKAGAQALDKFRENIRRHKRSAPVNKIPPKTKALTSYLKGAR